MITSPAGKIRVSRIFFTNPIRPFFSVSTGVMVSPVRANVGSDDCQRRGHPARVLYRTSKNFLTKLLLPSPFIFYIRNLKRNRKGDKSFCFSYIVVVQSQIMIEIKNIKKAFNGKEILKGISSVFYQGKTNMIIGASGTGKSVLLKSIVGLIQPDEGDVIYNDREFTRADKDTKREIRREIGMLFQGGALFDSKTVEENVMFPLDMLTRMSRAEKRDRVHACLERVGLSHALQRMPSEISGGMQKRVGIARAIVLNSKYLFVDEPNSGLDPLTAIKIDNLIQEITQEFNTTTVIVSHDMNSVMEIGENIIFLYKGVKLWEGTNKEIARTDVEELNEFVFSNKLLRDLKKHL